MLMDVQDIAGRWNRSPQYHLAAGDARLVEEQAHKIKGASATVGAEALRAVAWAMEQAGKTGDLEAARARVTDLDEQFKALNR